MSDHTERATVLVLRRIRRKLVVGLLARAAAWALVVFIACLAGGTIASIAGASAGWVVASAGAGILLALGVFLQQVRTLPTLFETARLVDHRFALKNRLSAALEAWPTSSVVGRALQRDADRHAETVDARAAFDWSRSALRVGVALVIAVSAYAGGLITLNLVGSRSDTAVADASLAAVDTSRPEEVAELADELRLEGTRDGDDYLKALADEADEVAQSLSAEPRSPAARERLRQLVRNLDSAYASGAISRDFAATLAARPSEVNSDATTDSASTAAANRAEDEGSDTTASSASSEADGSDVEASRPQAGQIGFDMQPSASDAPPARQAADREFVHPEALSGEDAREALRQAGAAPPQNLVGAAEQSSAGDSRLAGEGTSELNGDADTTAEALGSNAMELSGKLRDEGRHIEIDVTGNVGTGPGEPRASVSSWRAATEAAVENRPLGAWYRPIASRYFLPDQDLPGPSSRRSTPMMLGGPS